MDAKRRVAVITDADDEFGQAVARRLAADGMHLVLNSRGFAQTMASAAQLERQHRIKVLVTRFDLTRSAGVEAFLAQIEDTFGGLSLFVHTNRAVVRMSIEACDDALFQSTLDANVTTAFLCTQIIGKRMAEAGSGQVVYVGSIHCEKPTGSAFLFSVSQGAVQMLCREAALELGRHGVRVNFVEMGPVAGDDERFASELSDLYLNYRRKIPAAELGTPEDLASVVSFLASSDARFVNGAEIRVDGGFLLHYMDHKMKP
ncbi:MAG: SDR family oxidoreductase [Alicyclobacillus sp.]|nr:SDR family oxidoreductase [Alicyclobacillus sp.]